MTEDPDGERSSDRATRVDGGHWPLRHLTARMRCRAASLSDAPAIAAIGREAFPPTYAETLAPTVIDAVVSALYTDDAVAADIRAARANPASRFLVVESAEPADTVPGIDGFLHYDELGPEPELHRIYLRPAAIGAGVGSGLMTALNESLAAHCRYVLLVAVTNTRAVAFYRRHGLEVRESVDGIEYYRSRMGVDIDPAASPYPAYIMQRGTAARHHGAVGNEDHASGGADESHEETA